jgi:hypothetical protein
MKSKNFSGVTYNQNVTAVPSIIAQSFSFVQSFSSQLYGLILDINAGLKCSLNKSFKQDEHFLDFYFNHSAKLLIQLILSCVSVFSTGGAL